MHLRLLHPDHWGAGTHLINIVNTPGHTDFGGEVEHILSMVDGIALVVDVTEGPMTQTRFVLSKVLARGFKLKCEPLVVLNKSDRPTSCPAQIESDPYAGTLYLGRVHSGAVRPGEALIGIDLQGNKVGEGRVKKIYVRVVRMERVERDEAGAGEIISIAGIKGVNITLLSADMAEPMPLPAWHATRALSLSSASHYAISPAYQNQPNVVLGQRALFEDVRRLPLRVSYTPSTDSSVRCNSGADSLYQYIHGRTSTRRLRRRER
ncbi:hypothetical protein DFH07DRAFT_971988 [Mycena maculata]|uniref:Tr-type G domain-containing protein n=1 Tax=Mycena maculata TaxID=230809 RepID=A0AAD7HKT5_9AGAR|nr:hypothetical protein DFH07DRAFT_971988 [Mycena maculata]